MPPYDSDSEATEDDEEFGDWLEEDPTPVPSLFDDKTFNNAQSVLDQAKDAYKVDLIDIANRLSLDFYSIVRFINWIRKEHPPPQDVSGLTQSKAKTFLENDEYLKPSIEDDKLLQLEWDELLGSSSEPPQESEVDRLRRQVGDLTALTDDLKRMLYERLTEDTQVPANANVQTDRADASTSRLAPGAFDSIDRSYFDSYAENDIHEIMLKDKIRTESYRNFILESTAFKDKVVLDVGCGSGILSMFASQAGAKHVYAIDASNIAVKARLNVQENGLQNRVTVIQGKVEEIDLPVKTVDIIVSEWMGYLLLYESMLDSVLVARDRFLAPGGLLAPSQCSLFIGGLESDEVVDSSLYFWEDVYGFKMNAMKDIHAEEVMVEHVLDLATDSHRFQDICLTNLTTKDLECIESSFDLCWTRKATLTCLVIWFDTFFTKDGRLLGSKDALQAGELAFSTGPGAPNAATHWKQAVLVLKKPLTGDQGHRVSGQIKLRKDADNRRALDVEITMQDGDQQRAQRWQLK